MFIVIIRSAITLLRIGPFVLFKDGDSILLFEALPQFGFFVSIFPDQIVSILGKNCKQEVFGHGGKSQVSFVTATATTFYTRP